jgi:hypothetical protein
MTTSIDEPTATIRLWRVTTAEPARFRKAGTPMCRLLRVLIFCVALLQAVSCGGSSTSGPEAGGPPPDTSYQAAPGDTRDWLTVSQLTSNSFPERSPFHNGYFMPIGEAAPAVHAFRGSLQLQDHTIATSGPQTQDGERLDRLPAIELDFISHGEYLVPIDRDRQFDSGNGS